MFMTYIIIDCKCGLRLFVQGNLHLIFTGYNILFLIAAGLSRTSGPMFHESIYCLATMSILL